MSVGATVLRAVQDTRRVVGVNTNLGIVLLLAPLARAAGAGGGPLRPRVAGVLASLTLEDARDAFAAIRLASPAGLGTAAAEDVREEPKRTLREAMALAAERDSIAREYATDYELTFGTVVPALKAARAAGLSWSGAALEAYLRTLAEVPDTLVARKLGREAALAVSAGARAVLAAPPAGTGRGARGIRRRPARRRQPQKPGDDRGSHRGGLFVAMGEEL